MELEPATSEALSHSLVRDLTPPPIHNLKVCVLLLQLLQLQQQLLQLVVVVGVLYVIT